MNDQERSPFGVAVYLEHRGDRSVTAYDETTPSSIPHPNGTVITSGHRGFVGAALLAVVDAWLAE